MASWADIATLAMNPDGMCGFRREHEWGSEWCSLEGMQKLIEHRNLIDRFSEALDAFESWLSPLCRDHGRVWDRDEFSWELNDYAEWGDDPRSPVFMLQGWHDRENVEYCVVAWARGTLDGSLIACEGEWRRCEVGR